MMQKTREETKKLKREIYEMFFLYSINYELVPDFTYFQQMTSV